MKMQQLTSYISGQINKGLFLCGITVLLIAWLFQSPPGTIMQLDFSSFNVPSDSSGSCESYVEIRDWYPATQGLKQVFVQPEPLFHSLCLTLSSSFFLYFIPSFIRSFRYFNLLSISISIPLALASSFILSFRPSIRPYSYVLFVLRNVLIGNERRTLKRIHKVTFL